MCQVLQTIIYATNILCTRKCLCDNIIDACNYPQYSHYLCSFLFRVGHNLE